MLARLVLLYLSRMAVLLVAILLFFTLACAGDPTPVGHEQLPVPAGGPHAPAQALGGPTHAFYVLTVDATPRLELTAVRL